MRIHLPLRRTAVLGAVLTSLLSVCAARAQPILFFSQPFDGEKDVPVNSPVIFTFSEAMRTNYDITWSVNVTAANFNCVWTATDKLTCTYNTNLPANATITWTLNPAVFKNLAGEALFPFNNSGSFATASGAVTNCPGQTNGTGFFSITKSAQYQQTSDATATLDPASGPAFVASLSPPTNNPVTGASVTLPDSTVKTLSNFFGASFFFFEEFSSVAGLDGAYPSGNYIAGVRRSTGANQSGTVNFSTSARPPVPRVSNYAAVQTINPAADFTLNWDTFTGAAPQAFLSLTIISDAGIVIYPPPPADPCAPAPGLPVTATSVTIPANQFSPGTNYTGRLTFSNTTGSDSNSIPGIWVFASISQTTEFTLKTIGGSQPTQPRFTQVTLAANGVLQLQLSGPTDASIAIEVSANLSVWAQLFTTNASSGTVQFQDPSPATLSQRFYRARTQ